MQIASLAPSHNAVLRPALWPDSVPSSRDGPVAGPRALQAIRKPDPAQAAAIARRLDQILYSIDEVSEKELIDLNLDDVRTMSSWGMTMYGEWMQTYFALSMLEEDARTIPVRLSEVRHMRKGLSALMPSSLRMVSDGQRVQMKGLCVSNTHSPFRPYV